MKQLQIAVEMKQGGLKRKTLTFPIPDEMVEHIEKLYNEMGDRLSNGEVNTDPMVGFVIEGNRQICLGLSIMERTLSF